MRTSSLDEINKRMQDPRPVMGGLLTDPTPGRVRRLEKRVAKLEAMLEKYDGLEIKNPLTEV